MEQSDKRFAIFAVCVIAVLFALGGFKLWQAENHKGSTTIPYSTFLSSLEKGEVRNVTIAGQRLEGRLSDGRAYKTLAPNDPNLLPALKAKPVVIYAAPPQAPELSPLMLAVVISALVLLLAIAILLAWRGAGGAGAGASGGLGKSRARLRGAATSPVTFADVAGVDEAREGLQEIVDFLKDPPRFQRLGGHIPRGVLLVGPPGAGKTLLARAIAGEAAVPFFTISGSDFVEMFVGVGASRVRALFEQAKKHAPCIVFMDEIDAVGRKRGAGVGGGNDEREQTLNQLLVEMDGFDSDSGVILIAATNRPDVLDPALLRPGRFDREIVVATPDVVGREAILAVHARRTPLAPDVDLKQVARRTPGFSGADLMNLVNEAALLAVRRQRDDVSAREFEDAKDTVTMGTERRTHVMTEDERRLTAYREGGRVIVALNAPAADPVHKATIMTRGRQSGMVKQLPDEDRPFMTLRQMTSRLAILMAGRAAEELVFGPQEITSGAAGDIEAATDLARTMVTRWGLSKALGPVAYGENQDEIFLGASITRTQNVSEQTAQVIAVETRALVEGALGEARQILTGRRAQLETVAQGLLQYESLSGDEITALLAGRPPVRDTAHEPAPLPEDEA